MGTQLNVTLNDDIVGRFRMEVGRRYGYRRGNLYRATTEAMELWMKTPEETTDE
jgi:hypothetical protein